MVRRQCEVGNLVLMQRMHFVNELLKKIEDES